MYRLFDTLAVIHKYKRLYERRCQGLMKKYDLRIADIDILLYVSRAGEKNLAKDIADEGMSKANISKSVEHLHSKGYVELYEDKSDRRCVHIKPTEIAIPIIQEAEDIRKEMGSALSVGISTEDKQATFRVMQQLCRNMSQELEETEDEILKSAIVEKKEKLDKDLSKFALQKISQMFEENNILSYVEFSSLNILMYFSNSSVLYLDNPIGCLINELLKVASVQGICIMFISLSINSCIIGFIELFHSYLTIPCA